MFNTIETPIVVYRSAGGNELRRILIQCQAQMITDVRGGGVRWGGGCCCMLLGKPLKECAFSVEAAKY